MGSARGENTPARQESVKDAPGDDDHENRLDFELLMRRQQSASSRSTIQTTPGLSRDEVWPLYLTTYFVDHYILGDVVGNGAYAEVRECVDSRDLTRCAVKIVNKNYLRRQAPRALSNQKQEIKLLRRLKHENIISLRETLYKGPKIYIFLEYCSFVLSDLLQNERENNRLPIQIARNLFAQLLRGLEYLHSQSIVHRDVKPQNLLITTSGKLKIIDFGVSQILSIWNWPSDLCQNYEGSPLFQAPEVVNGQSEYAGFKVDTWSAGITLYLMLYGQYPFFDGALLGLYDKILTEPLSIPNIDKNELVNDCLLQQQKAILTDLLAAMLEKEAAKRCSIAEALDHPWLTLRESQSVESGKCQDNGFLLANEHSEFIELLNHWHQVPLASSSSESPVAKSDNVPSSDSPTVNGSHSSSSSLNEESVSKQRDIYLSMSVLPYLYSHHFSHIPVVKAANRRTNSSSSATTSPSSSSSCGTSTSPSPTPSPQQDSYQSSISPSIATIDSDAGGESTSAESSVSSASSSSGSNPHEMIADKQIEWGTRDQYNLLKLPLIRVNRLRSTKKSGVGGLRRRRRHRRGDSE